MDFSKHVDNLIEKYINLPNESVLVPSRTTAGFATYPRYQQNIENFLNYFMGDYIGIENDYYFGPKIYPLLCF